MTDIVNFEETEIDGHFYPEPLLKALLDSVQVANQVNDASWSVVRIRSGTLVVFVEKTNVMAIRQSGGDLTFLGDINDGRFNSLSGYQVNQPDSSVARFHVSQLSTHDFLDVLSRFQSQHHAFVQHQASAVRTRTQRANEHNQNLIDEISSALDAVSVAPAYIQTDAGQPDSSLTSEAKLDTTSSAFEIREYPEPILRAIAFAVKAAHEANPRAWALAVDEPYLVLLVGNTVSMLASPRGGAFIASGTVDADVAETLKPDDIYTSYPFEAFYLRGLDKDEYLKLFTRYSDQHVEAARQLARTVKTRAHHHHRHRQDVVEQIAGLLNVDLPAPGYYGEEFPPSTGYWRYSVAKTIWNEELSNGYLSSQDWPNPAINLKDLPAKEDVFGSHIESLSGSGPESSRRLWNIAKQMSLGDQVIAHQGTKILATGIVNGEYEFHPDETTSKHRRPINWTTNLVSFDFSKSPAATRAKSGWGTVPLTEEDYLVLTEKTLNTKQPISPLDIAMSVIEAFDSRA